MPRPQTQRANAAMRGYERGSVFDRLSHEQQRAFRRWLAEETLNNRVKEQQLSGRRFIRPRSLKEV